MRRFLFLAAAMAVAVSASAREYAAGQLWSYKTRPGDERSLILIDYVEAVPRIGTVYHISVLQVHMLGSEDDTDLPHFPVSRYTLDISVIALAGVTHPHLAFREGYDEWRTAFDKGRAGVFTVPVFELVSSAEARVANSRAWAQ